MAFLTVHAFIVSSWHCNWYHYVFFPSDLLLGWPTPTELLLLSSGVPPAYAHHLKLQAQDLRDQGWFLKTRFWLWCLIKYLSKNRHVQMLWLKVLWLMSKLDDTLNWWDLSCSHPSDPRLLHITGSDKMVIPVLPLSEQLSKQLQKNARRSQLWTC